MKKSTKLLAGAVAVAIGGLAMTNIASAYTVTYHPEANVSYTLNSGFDTSGDFTAGLITITDGDETYTIMDRNLGATAAGTGCEDPNWGSACAGGDPTYGYYFQWGNNYGFSSDPNASITTSDEQVDASEYGPGHYYSSSTFITSNSWDSSENNNLWGGVSGTNEAMQGPCPEGYHVPSSEEWLGLSTMLGYPSNNSQAINSLRNELYLPLAGYRGSSAGVIRQGTVAFYWSSTAYSADHAYGLLFYSSYGLNPQNGNLRSNGFSVRCFKNSPYSASDLSSEGGDSEIIVNIAEFNGGQNTCTGSNYIFENIVAGTSTGTHTLSGVFQCTFGNGRSSSTVTLQLSGDLVADGDRVISGSNLMMKNSEWGVSPAGLKFADTLISTWRALTATQTLFQKTANLIGVASGVVEVQLTVPGGTPDGTYNGTLVLTY